MCKAYLILIVVTAFAWCANAKQIVIEAPSGVCVTGAEAVDVVIRIEGEKFSFRAQCFDWLNKDFELSDRTPCRIQAGMCTSVSPSHKIQVECEGSYPEFVDVECP